ncbi:NTP transferase domain-containing protein [Erythrobacter sp.]|jgi:CTP:molybdopterin cytidylyltransferase MocA|uniref:NTP transferase domain-containing protein n=1 Tax=Erythrobacter sp. TaxID=1042 RepID=UPI002EB5928F|nr:NTP transferase domain-containing protein [Erythrobacter sp.]
MATQSDGDKVTVLVLAASRAGPHDAVAQLQGVSHKCLVELDGEIMLARVVREIAQSRHAGDIWVSIEDEALLRQVPYLARLMEEGRLYFVPAGDNLFASIMDAADTIPAPYPLVVSTGDNALHTAEMFDHFCAEMLASGADAAVAMTPASTILEAYPDGKRAFHELKDGGWSSCNLYGVANAQAIRAARVFETGGQFGKQPRRILKAFGLRFMLMYRFSLATIDQLARYLSKRWGVRLAVVRMPFADAPIDVDNPGDFVRTEAILKARRGED